MKEIVKEFTDLGIEAKFLLGFCLIGFAYFLYLVSGGTWFIWVSVFFGGLGILVFILTRDNK
jgi:hypothetical protein